VVTRPRTTSAHLRNAQLVELRRDASLLVAVMDDGRVRERILPTPAPVSQEQLNDRRQRLYQLLGGKDAQGIAGTIPDLIDPDDIAVAEVLGDILREQRVAEETYVEGLSNALRQPEFSDVDRLLEAVGQLQAYRLRGLLEP